MPLLVEMPAYFFEDIDREVGMPVRRDSRTGKYRIGSGKAMYKSKASANRAYRAYLAKKHSRRR